MQKKFKMQISNTNAISLSSDKFQAWILAILMNEPPQSMQSNEPLNTDLKLKLQVRWF